MTTIRRAAAVCTLALTATLGLAGPAAAVCDAYSGTCTEPPAVLPNELVRPAPAPAPAAPAAAVRGAVVPAVETPATLPFTGGELVLLSTLGVGAVAGGVVLVAAGRRRSQAPQA